MPHAIAGVGVLRPMWAGCPLFCWGVVGLTAGECRLPPACGVSGCWRIRGGACLASVPCPLPLCVALSLLLTAGECSFLLSLLLTAGEFARLVVACLVLLAGIVVMPFGVL